MAFCRFCGANVPDDAGFCPQCGGSMATEEHTAGPQAEQGSYSAGPGSQPGGGPAPGGPDLGGGPGPDYYGQPRPLLYDRKALKRASRDLFQTNYWPTVGVTLVAGLLGAGPNYITIILDNFSWRWGWMAGFSWPWPINVAWLILSGVVGLGVAEFFLTIYQGRESRFSQMFNGFNNFGKGCGAGLLIALFTFLWSLLLVIPGIIKGLSYSMTYYIMNDHPELTAREAIRASQRMMDGHKADLFVLGLSYIGWFLLSGLTAGLLYLFYVGPWLSTATAGFYDIIKGEYQDPRQMAQA